MSAYETWIDEGCLPVLWTLPRVFDGAMYGAVCVVDCPSSLCSKGSGMP
jgi:hypothetical protein